jgi:hypothetical protein
METPNIFMHQYEESQATLRHYLQVIDEEYAKAVVLPKTNAL